MKPRIKVDHQKIQQIFDTSGTSHWKIEGTGGGYKLFGSTEHSCIRSGNRIAQWNICKTVSSNKEEIVYHYKTEDKSILDVYNRNTNAVSNSYLSRIQYGCYLDSNNVRQYAFSTVFDYGEYNLNSPDEQPKQWVARENIYTNCDWGFKVVTTRLCRNIITINELSDELIVINQRGLAHYA